MIWPFWGPAPRTRNVTPGDKSYLIRASRGKCEYCGRDIIGKGITPNIHHIVEKASGGSDGYHNLIVLCPNCHSVVHGVGISKEKLRAKIAYRLREKASILNVPTEKVSTKKTAAKKATAKKVTPKKTAAKKATATKTTRKKATTKRVSTTKTAPKKTTARKR